MTIRNVRWELEATFSRKEVIAMAKVAEFFGNIRSHLSKEFESSVRGVEWDEVRQVMSKFASMGEQDTIAYRLLCEGVSKINANKMMFLSGKVVEKEESSDQ